MRNRKIIDWKEVKAGSKFAYIGRSTVRGIKLDNGKARFTVDACGKRGYWKRFGDTEMPDYMPVIVTRGSRKPTVTTLIEKADALLCQAMRETSNERARTEIRDAQFHLDDATTHLGA